MKLLPTIHDTIHTQLTKPEVKEQLNRLIEKPSTQLFPKRDANTPPFSGAILDREFELQRPYLAFSRRNSYAPFITGRIEDTEPGSEIHLTFHPSSVTQAGLAALILFTLGGTAILVTSIVSGQPATCVIVLPYIVIALLYFILRQIYVSSVAQDRDIVRTALLHSRTRQPDSDSEVLS